MAQSTLPTLALAVDRDHELPLGTQLAWKLRAGIAAGRLTPGDRLPSVRELATAAGVNVNTARSVYARLEDEGYIVSRQGAGTFVSHGARAGAGLERLAGEAAAEARAAGVDPRDLAAAIFAAAEEPPLPPELPSRISSTPLGPLPDINREGDQRGARRTLRRQIAKLEAELGAYAEHLRPAEAAHPALLPKAHVASVAELEATRDRLLDQLSKVRNDDTRRADRRQQARAQLDELVRAPERHKWQWVSNEDLGEPGCKYWHSRPRFGLLGAVCGWWRVKVSSGCPLASA